MREKMINYANSIIEDNNIINVYKDLAELFATEELYSPQANCLKRIWHITFEPELLKKEGDVYLNSLDEPESALESYKLYLQVTNPQFYVDFMNSIYYSGYTDFNSELVKIQEISPLIKLADKYAIIIYMIMLMHKLEDYEGILILSKYLDKIQENIDNYVNNNDYNDEDFLEIKRHNTFLSNLISSTLKNIDLNILAIKLNDENKQAYINIIEEFINQNQIEEGMNFYNNCFIPKFDNGASVINEVAFYWELSKICSSNEDYFNSIKYQQKAIDTELAQKGEKY